MGIGYLIFGNVDSRNYNIIVAFKDVDHTPKKVYQRIAIPGRNGEFYLDEKRFEDVPVSYDCIALDDDDRKSFVNALAAQIGHVRLEDTFNVGEFYSAVFEGDVDPYVTQDRENSTFTIQFTRKPQRFLKSGETEVTVSSGDALNNPTKFESSPLIKTEGYGTVGFNGYEIEVEQRPVGDIVLAGTKNFSLSIPVGNSTSSPIDLSGTIVVDTANLNTDDPINFIGTRVSWTIDLDQSKGQQTVEYVRLYSETGITADTSIYANGSRAVVTTSFPPIPFIFGTASTAEHRTGFQYSYVDSTGTTSGTNFKDISIAYDGAQTFTISVDGASRDARKSETVTFTTTEIDAYSSVIITDPVFIDCELGEAYWLINNEAVDANSLVAIGAELPTLASGANPIEYDSSFTSVEITPRWWQL